jgi:hypothetical protein
LAFERLRHILRNAIMDEGISVLYTCSLVAIITGILVAIIVGAYNSLEDVLTFSMTIRNSFSQ